MSASAPSDLLNRLINARATQQVEAIMAGLPIVPPDDYQWVSFEGRSAAWKPGHLHWLPVGLDRAAMGAASSSLASL